ncbi:hypothetical protein JQX13_17205 [Archangium violaceum]|uniref:RCC1 domain-containing protein n=1 Tax=Archangium violaceum TaxID=83451 RepID=UPI00193C1A77|nr:hypothetical protein [Archangium violaceum]QRK11651.1 hypothetical protein JQX13_17205 [Archangium violaceum]
MARRVAAGHQHSLAVDEDGGVWVWGMNTSGQLSNGQNETYSTPVRLPELTGVVAITTHDEHSLALRADGTVWAWGTNRYLQLGVDDLFTDVREEPAPIPGLTGVVSISAGYFHAVAARQDGSVWTWGLVSKRGETNYYFPGTTPVQVPGLSDAVRVTASAWTASSLALRRDGTLWGWGSNASGQLGNGTTLSQDYPVQVVGMEQVVAVSASVQHSLALREDGTLWAWGSNAAGKLGTGTDRRLAPVRVLGPANTVSVSAGASHSLALHGEGTVWAWGNNARGQLGDGTTGTHATPIQVQGLSDVVALSAGSVHAVAVSEDGSMRSWGDNTSSQIGDGVSVIQPTPSRVLLPCRLTGGHSHEHLAGGSRHCHAQP